MELSAGQNTALTGSVLTFWVTGDASATLAAVTVDDEGEARLVPPGLADGGVVVESSRVSVDLSRLPHSVQRIAFTAF